MINYRFLSLSFALILILLACTPLSPKKSPESPASLKTNAQNTEPSPNNAMKKNQDSNTPTSSESNASNHRTLVTTSMNTNIPSLSSTNPNSHNQTTQPDNPQIQNSHYLTCLQNLSDTNCNLESLFAELNSTNQKQRAENLKAIVNAQPNQKENIVALLPLTGTARRIGRAMMGSILLAQQTFSSFDSPINVIFIDTQSNPEKITDAFKQILSIKPKAIIGPVDLQETTYAAKKANEFKIPLVSFSIDPNFANDYAIQLAASPELQIQELIKKASRIYPQLKVLILSSKSKYADTMAHSFKKWTSDQNLTIVDELFTDPKSTDLRKDFENLNTKDFNTIFFPSSIADTEKMTSFLAQQNIWCQEPKPQKQTNNPRDTRKFVLCLGNNTWSPINTNHNLRTTKNAIYPENFYPQSQSAQDFVTSFNNLYHRTPGVHEALAFDAIQLIIYALQNNANMAFPNKITQLPTNAIVNHLKKISDNKILLIPSILQITNTSTTPLSSPQ